jgi:hypothetical protein
MLQYFQMDPKTYDDEGIDHAKFCFQVICYRWNIRPFHIFFYFDSKFYVSLRLSVIILALIETWLL